MKRQQRTIGAVITIPLPNGYRAYGRILKNAAFAFYDCISQDELAEVEQILQSNVLFIVAAFDSIIHQGRWLKIYKAPIEPILENLPKKYIEEYRRNYARYKARVSRPRGSCCLGRMACRRAVNEALFPK
jgi:hypothetical protein